ncbi:MAG: hypothetical protein HYR55_04545 [Acidobacteria bacterium]|nr:hypothetical protein [Acidobacteriota bacterium]MBI3657558.1 hypothetical protein [Acidobacteriota bacterium]
MRRMVIVALILILGLPAALISQTTDKPPGGATRRPPARGKSPAINARADAAKVAEQLKLLTRFIYLYGKISAGLETAEEQVRRGELDPELSSRIAKNRSSVVDHIRGIRAGLEKLDQHFQSKSRTTRTSIRLIGAADQADAAEQLAGAGRFDEAGRALLRAAEQLLDFLVELR